MSSSDSQNPNRLGLMPQRERIIRRDLMMVVLTRTTEMMESINNTFRNVVQELTQLIKEETSKLSSERLDAEEGLPDSPPIDHIRPIHDTRPIHEVTRGREGGWKFDDFIERIKFTHTDADSKLDVDSDFFMWMAKIRSELQAQGVLFCLDDSIPVPNHASESGLRRLEDKVMHLIRSRISDDLHSIIMQCESAKGMVDGLENAIAPISKTNEYSLRIQFGNMKYEKGSESAVQFIQRYEQLIRQMKRCPDIVMNEREKRTGFVMAVRAQSESIRVAEAASEGKLTYEKMKGMLRDEELLEKDATRRDNAVGEKALTLMKRKHDDTQEDHSESKKPFTNSRLKCFQCGVIGHTAQACANKDKGRLCYVCQQFTKDHLAATCPLRPSSSKTAVVQPGTWNKKTDLKGLKIKRMNKAMGRKNKMRKLAFKKAVKFGKTRKEKGKTALLVFTDSEDENCVPEEKVYYVDCADLSKGELEEADEGHGSDSDQDCSAKYVRTDDEEDSHGRAFNITSKSFKPTTLTLIIDSGATEHFVKEKNVFTTLRKLPTPKRILCANSNKESNLLITHEGDIAISGDSRNLECLKNVLYAPTIAENLFSIRKLRGKGVSVTFSDSEVEIKNIKEGLIMAKGYFYNKLWQLKFTLPLANKSPQVVSKVMEHFSDNSKRGSTNLKRKIFLTDEEPSTSSSLPQNLPFEEPLPVNPTKKTRGNPSKVDTTVLNDNVSEADLSALQKQRESSNRESKGLLWHYRLNHASKGYLEVASKILPEMKGSKFSEEIFDCEACKLAKAKRKPFKSIRNRATTPLTRVHSDLMGKITPCSLRSGANYIVTFTDDFSRFNMSFPIANKMEVHLALKDFLKEARRILGDNNAKIQEIRTDGGLEYKTQGMRDILREEGISLDVCAPATPQHNGVAERQNLELQEKIRVNLLSAGMPAYYWPHALSYVTHVHNRTPNKSIDFKTPYEVFTGRKPNVGYIRRFGCKAYVLNQKPKPKFAPRARLAYLLECNETCYTLFATDTKTLVRSKHVDFIESQVYGDKFGPDANAPLQNELSFDMKLRSADQPHSNSENLIGESNEYEFYETNDDPDGEDAQYLALISTLDNEEPAQYKDAVNSPDWPQWLAAINDELDSHDRCGTWKLVKCDSLPPNTNLIKTRWVNKKKIEIDGRIRFKSRLVAKGFGETNYYDKSEIYAPVARLGDIRFLIAVVNKFDLDWVHLDVKTAFLNGKLEKPVFMEIPEGLEEKKGKKLKGKYACELKRALYGLKVAPKRWYLEFSKTMKDLGFETYPFQSCLFILNHNDHYVIGLLYVDDLILASKDTVKLSNVKQALMTRYKMTDLGEPKRYLALEIERDRANKTIFVHQKHFITSILDRFGIHGGRIYDIPMSTPDSIRKKEVNERTANSSNFDENTIPYRQAIGSLIYLMNGTRPDISVAVNILSRRQTDFDKHCWKQVNQVFRYLLGTTSFGICFKGERDDLCCYPDASLGISDPRGQSTSGFAVLLFGDLISWKCRKQTHVAQSSQEAEFITMSMVCREAASIRDMCQRMLGLSVKTIVYEDNQAAIALATTEESKTLKHFVNLFYHYVRDEFAKGNIDIRWISTTEQLGDFFTKPLSKPKFEKFRDTIMTSA